MTTLQDAALRRSEQLWFAAEDIEVKPGRNGRDLSTPENVAHIKDIAGKIERKGFLESHPIEYSVEGATKYLTDGHIRHAAVMLLISEGKGHLFPKGIPCVREPKGTNEVDRILNQDDVHNSGKPLSPLEHGYNLKRALAMGLSIAEVAERIGKSASHVQQAIDFQAAPAEVHAAVKAGAISATEAAKIVRREGAGAVVTITKAIEKANAGGKTRATARHVSRAAPAGTFAVKDIGGGLWAVTIDGTTKQHSVKFWTSLAHELLDKEHQAEIFVREQDQRIAAQ